MAKTHVTIVGIKELTDKIGRVQMRKIFRLVMTPQAKNIQGITSKYPRSTSANRPNAKGVWYERGYGTKRNTKQGVRGRKTSETLSKQWKVDVGAAKAVISNRASYAEFVHGARQARFHKGRGWKQIEDVIMDNLARIEDAFKNHIDRLLK